jgi:signal peptidase II
MKQRIPYFLLIIFLLIADQVTKALIARNIILNSSKQVIPGFFQLVHIRNRGAIFGFFSQSGNRYVFLFLTLASLAALGLVVYYFFKASPEEKWLKVSLSLIIAGALGNFMGRVFKGYVIDFLDVSVKGWHWPSFNVADSCISIGAVLLILIFLFKRSPTCSPSSSRLDQ